MADDGGMTEVPFAERPYSPDAPDEEKWWHLVRSAMQEPVEVPVPGGRDEGASGRADDAPSEDVPSNYELHLMMLDGRIRFLW